MTIVDSIRAEYMRYKALAESAIAQLDDAQLSIDGDGGGNSIAVICWHVAGNLKSRFTDFLTTDGEKPWRQREEEFQRRQVTRAELLVFLAKSLRGHTWKYLSIPPGQSDAYNRNPR